MSNIAVIDIGTNTVLLLIAKIFPNHSYEILCDEIRFPRLGEGLDKTFSFSQAAQTRVLQALNDYKTIIEHFSCQHILVTGTAPFRKAKRPQDFVETIRQRLGFQVRILSGEEEAQFVHLAASAAFPHLEKPVLVLDIGGGSTEFIFDDDRGAGPRAPTQEISLPIGVVNLTEQFLFSDPATEKELHALQNFIQKSLKTLPPFSVKNLIATAGTPTTLCAMVLGLAAYDAKKIHGQNLKLVLIENLFQRLAALTLGQKQKIPGLTPGRADVIIAGTLLLIEVLERFRLKDFFVSDHSLRHGVLLDWLSKSKGP